MSGKVRLASGTGLLLPMVAAWQRRGHCRDGAWCGEGRRVALEVARRVRGERRDMREKGAERPAKREGSGSEEEDELLPELDGILRFHSRKRRK